MTVNPYLRRAAAHRFQRWGKRGKLVDEYAWAIPNERALRTIAKYGPVIEIGAGTGYWASLLRARGVDILPFDRAPIESGENDWFTEQSPAWTLVHKGTAEQAGKYPERSLMLCWPPYGTAMASDALREYTSAGGKVVIYIGEGKDGCTGDAAFHEMLEADYDEIECVQIPQWGDMEDRLHVYRRKESRQDEGAL